jgi:hypothetical protein
MNESTRRSAYNLLMTGSLVSFRIVDEHTELAPDKENIAVRVDLVFEGEDEDDEPVDIVEWGAFGFLFTIAVLSFHDAKPRGLSEGEFSPNDEFTVHDFMECLTFGRNGLLFCADYVRGRCMKTDVTIRPDGTVTLSTWGRGKSALRWLDTLQGKKLMAVVSSAGESEKQ